MADDFSSNKRIAKNTLLLYARMLLLLVVYLYTSRIVLVTLGVEDYGLYKCRWWHCDDVHVPKYGNG